MKIQGITDYINASFTYGTNSATITVTCESKYAERYLGRTITATIPGTGTFSFILNAITSYGLSTGIASLSGVSLVDRALQAYYKAQSAPIASGRNFKGIWYRGFDTNGDLIPMTLDNAIKHIIATAQTEINELVGQSLEVEFRGRNIEKTTELIEWDASKIGSMIKGYIGPLDDVLMFWDGDTIVIKRFDIDQSDIVIKETDVIQPRMGLNLANVASSVTIESIDIRETIKNDAPVGVSPLNKLVNNNFSTSWVTNSKADIDENLSVLRVSEANPSSGGLGDPPTPTDAFYGYDARIRKTSGNRYNDFDWVNPLVMSDQDLGKINTVTTQRNRLSSQAKLANELADNISKLEYTGSFMVEKDYRICVGDVAKLWNKPNNVIIMGISCDTMNDTKSITYGNKSGSTYETIKSREELAPAVKMDELQTFNMLSQLVKGLDLTPDQQKEFVGNKTEILKRMSGRGESEPGAANKPGKLGWVGGGTKKSKSKSEHGQKVADDKAKRIEKGKEKEKSANEAKEKAKADLKLEATITGPSAEKNVYSAASKAEENN